MEKNNEINEINEKIWVLEQKITKINQTLGRIMEEKTKKRLLK